MNQPLLKTLLARQGIYNKDSSVFAYELLYRNGDSFTSNVDNLNNLSGDAATSSVLTHLFTNLDIDTITGDKPAFINFTHNHLVQQIPKLLPKNRIVVEVLETVEIDEPLINSLIELSKQGYKIALDDFIFRDELNPLIDIADIIKIDVLNCTKEQIAEQLVPLKHFKGKFLAEKIEDKAQFNNCVELGFDYFQGFFLNKPDPLKGKSITESKSNLLRLLSELNDDAVSIHRVEEIILQIPQLSYRILRLTNSAALSTGKKIESLMDAIRQLGLLQIRNWLSIMLLSSMDDVLPDVLERTLIRAKMCESLAQASGHPNPHQAYTVGILSTLDIILNEPMENLLAQIPLSDALNQALIGHKGTLGKLLKYTLDHEAGHFDALENSFIKDEGITSAYLDGIEHAQSILSILKK